MKSALDPTSLVPIALLASEFAQQLQNASNQTRYLKTNEYDAYYCVAQQEKSQGFLGFNYTKMSVLVMALVMKNMPSDQKDFVSLWVAQEVAADTKLPLKLKPQGAIKQGKINIVEPKDQLGLVISFKSNKESICLRFESRKLRKEWGTIISTIRDKPSDIVGLKSLLESRIHSSTRYRQFMSTALQSYDDSNSPPNLSSPLLHLDQVTQTRPLSQIALHPQAPKEPSFVSIVNSDTMVEQLIELNEQLKLTNSALQAAFDRLLQQNQDLKTANKRLLAQNQLLKSNDENSIDRLSVQAVKSFAITENQKELKQTGGVFNLKQLPTIDAGKQSQTDELRLQIDNLNDKIQWLQTEKSLHKAAFAQLEEQICQLQQNLEKVIPKRFSKLIDQRKVEDCKNNQSYDFELNEEFSRVVQFFGAFKLRQSQLLV